MFFLLAAIPTFMWLRERGQPRELPAGVGYPALAWSRVRGTLGHLGQHRDLAVLLLSVFFAMNGIYIIITYAFIYGAQIIEWDAATRTWMFIAVQVTAAIGALGFGFLQDALGAMRTYRITLWMWMLAVALIYLTPIISNLSQQWLGVPLQAQQVFLLVGCAAGLSLGACQSATRTLVGLFAPSSRVSEFFGFWGLSLKLAGASGLLLIGLLQSVFGLQRAILACVAMFFVAWLVSLSVNQQRGEQASGSNDPT